MTVLGSTYMIEENNKMKNILTRSLFALVFCASSYSQKTDERTYLKSMQKG